MSAEIVSKGKSDYVILLSSRESTIETLAANNFNKILKLTTKVELPILRECGTLPEKYISIGDTDALASQNFEKNYGRGGIGIVESNGNLFVFGEGYCGSVWAVQVFFEQTAGYRFYAKNEIAYDKKESIDISDFRYYYTPAIPNRCSGFALCRTDTEYATGLKAYTYYGVRPDETQFWGAWAHCQFQILPPEKYATEHPDWYNAEKDQLCLSNMDMRNEFFKNFTEVLKKNRTQSYFLLGHQDNYHFCYCENCKKRIAEVGTGGLCMEFINDIARRTEKWRLENCPERVISVGTLAYSLETSTVPPVKKDGDKYEPASKSVIAEPNVFIFFTPMDAVEHSRPFTNELNRDYYAMFKKWSLISKRFCCYSYFGSFRRCFEVADGMYLFKENIRLMKEIGCEYMFIENNPAKNSIFFQAMHIFVLTALEWDNERDTDELIDEFMSAYYKGAKEPMRRFFDYCIKYFAKVRERTEYFNSQKYTYGMCLTDTVPYGFWSLNALYDLNLMLDEADKIIDEGDYDAKSKEELHDRVELERLTLLCAELEYFVVPMTEYDEARNINAFTKDAANKICDRFEKGIKKFNIPRVDGDCASAFDTIARWRSEINTAARGWENRIKEFHDKVHTLFGENEVKDEK